MRFASVVTVCFLAMGCSSSSTNEAPAGGGAAGSGGVTGGSGGATGGSGGATGGSGGATGGSGGMGGAPVCMPGNSTGFLNCAPHKPSSMAVDSTQVYFALAAGGVEYLFRAPKAGISAPLSPWAKIGGGSVGDIVVSTSHVFVATTDENRQLIRYALADANETVLLDKTGCAAPFPDAPLAIDKTAVYYACKGTKSAIGMFKTGSSTGELAFTYPGSYVISGLGSNGSVLAIALGSLDYLPLPGGSAGLIDANDTYTRAAMIGNKIYAMTATTVKTFNYGGAGDADALSGLTGLVDFRVDATGIYAITTSKVVGKPLSQGTLSLNQTATPGGIALDATHVYWSSPTGLIERVAR
ncbi:MAG: hypothetical protein IT377_03435 [Polyangiaceae bacterium]|nr:hypothetical protein [Polyangiaceae bacterium]